MRLPEVRRSTRGGVGTGRAPSSLGGRVVVTDTDVEILDPVSFEPAKDVTIATSTPALDAVAPFTPHEADDDRSP